METLRRDFQVIADLVQPGSKVLDLGCGDGSLLSVLKREKQAEVRGIEASIDQVGAALARGISVFHGDVLAGLEMYPNAFFDVVILSRTIQEMITPHEALQEMLRVGKRGIVAFLNYGYIRNRLYYLFTGHRPKSPALPFEWHNTPNIHPACISEFETYCRQQNIHVIHRTFLKGDWERTQNFLPNLLAGYAIYLIEKIPTSKDAPCC